MLQRWGIVEDTLKSVLNKEAEKKQDALKKQAFIQSLELEFRLGKIGHSNESRQLGFESGISEAHFLELKQRFVTSSTPCTLVTDHFYRSRTRVRTIEGKPEKVSIIKTPIRSAFFCGVQFAYDAKLTVSSEEPTPVPSKQDPVEFIRQKKNWSIVYDTMFVLELSEIRTTRSGGQPVLSYEAELETKNPKDALFNSRQFLSFAKKALESICPIERPQILFATIPSELLGHSTTTTTTPHSTQTMTHATITSNNNPNPLTLPCVMPIQSTTIMSPSSVLMHDFLPPPPAPTSSFSSSSSSSSSASSANDIKVAIPTLYPVENAHLIETQPLLQDMIEIDAKCRLGLFLPLVFPLKK